MRDLKQVVPLAIPKESAEPLQEEVIEDGVKIFRKTSLDEKVTDRDKSNVNHVFY